MKKSFLILVLLLLLLFLNDLISSWVIVFWNSTRTKCKKKRLWAEPLSLWWRWNFWLLCTLLILNERLNMIHICICSMVNNNNKKRNLLQKPSCESLLCVCSGNVEGAARHHMCWRLIKPSVSEHFGSRGRQYPRCQLWSTDLIGAGAG